MALKIGLSSYVSAGFTNPVRWDLLEDVSGVKIDEHVEPGPHGQIYNFDWSDNIRDIAYRIMFYDVPGGVGLGNLIKSHVVTPSTQSISFDTDLELIVGGAQDYDPVAGNNSVIIPFTIGKKFYVQQRGIGQLLITRSVEVIPDTVNGGFSLTGGQTFNDGDIFILKFVPTFVINPPGTQQATSPYKAIVIVTDDITLQAMDQGKLFIVEGTNPVVTITLPPVADMINKVPFNFRSVGIVHNNVIIKASTGELITATGTTSNTFILGRAEDAEVIPVNATTDGALFGFTDSNDIKRAGQIDWNYSVELNRLWADGSQVLAADYPRIKKAMDNLEVGQVVTFSQWLSSVVIDGITLYPYKGFYALSNDGLTIQLPDFRNKAIRSLRYSDNTADDQRLQQGAGGLQNHAVGPHSHFIANTNSDTTGIPLVAANYLTVQGEQAGTADFKYTLRGSGTVPNIGKTSSGGTNVETRSINIGMIPCIIF